MTTVGQGTVLSALDDDHPDDALSLLAAGPDALWCPDISEGRLVVSRYRLVRSVITDTEQFGCTAQAERLLSSLPPRLAELMDPVRSWPLYSDPPNQTRIRAAMSRAFTARRVEALRPRVRDAVRAFVAAMGDYADVIAGLAVPLPVWTFAEMMGLPRQDHGTLKSWTADLIRMTEPTLTTADTTRIEDAWRGLWDYFTEVIQTKRSVPTGDVTSALAQDGPEGLHTTEVVSACISLLLGGHETTTNLIANVALALARNPQHRHVLGNNPGLAPGFVEEVMRTDAPAKTTARVVRKDTTIGETLVTAGTHVLLLLTAANRDPHVFDRPAMFDPERSPNPHLGFGFGVHACFGAALARLQGQEVAAALAATPRFDADLPSLTWRQSRVLRSLASLHVVLA